MCASFEFKFIFVVFSFVFSVCDSLVKVANPVNKEIKYESTINISLANFLINDKSTHIHKQYIVVSTSTTRIRVQAIKPTIGFFVIQVHSFGIDAVISNDTQFTDRYKISGTNIGLVQIVEPHPLPKFFYIKSSNETKSLLVIIAYDEETPVPGGCNLSFKTEIAPYQNISYTENLIKVESQAPSIPGVECEKFIPHVNIYQMYFSELDLTENTYFQGIESMLSPSDAVSNGTKVPLSKGNSLYRKYYSAYPGTGVIFAIVVHLGNSSAAYVPIVTYACDAQSLEGCFSPVSVEWKVLCAFAFFIGIFLCFFGHWYFKTGLFCIGFLVTFVVVFMLRYALFGDFSNWYSVLGYELGALFVSVIFGTFWILMWEKWGKPLIVMLLNITLIGFFIASSFFYFYLGDITIFENDVNFWGVFCCISIVTIGLLPWSSYANIFVCSFVGSLAILLPIDHYIGSNLRYIIINTVRRATVTHFNEAIILPPFQCKDVALTVVWILLTCMGCTVQVLLHRRRPPFPPPLPRNQPPTERTPLLPADTAPSAPPAPPTTYYGASSDLLL